MKTLIPTVNNLSDSKSNKTKWRGRIWHVAKYGGPTIHNYTVNSKSKIDYSVFKRVFTNPDKPSEMNAEYIESIRIPKNKNLDIVEKSARPVKEVKEKVVKVKIKGVKTPKPKYVKTGKPRGRKAENHNLKFPKTKFTIKDVAAKNKVEPYVINNYINRVNKAKTELFKSVGTVDKKPGQRGKKQLYWMKIK